MRLSTETKFSNTKSLHRIKNSMNKINNLYYFKHSAYKSCTKLTRRVREMSSIDFNWHETSFATSKWYILKDWQNSSQNLLDGL